MIYLAALAFGMSLSCLVVSASAFFELVNDQWSTAFEITFAFLLCVVFASTLALSVYWAYTVA